MATLLLRAKVDAHRVLRILRHVSINTTLGTYGHLDVEDLRDAINTLPTGPAVPEMSPHGAPVVRNFSPAKAKAESAEISSTDPAFLPHDPAGIRTRVCVVRGRGGASDGLAPGASASQAVGDPRGGLDAAVHPLAPDGILATPHGARVVRKFEGPGGVGRLLTVREVAECLAVCTATVYALCERGEIRHLWVSNAIRIHPADLEDFIAGQER